ncbi:MAG: 4Fe-4S binding protein [Bacteroidetes bacterium]|jgi:Na+-translocating ferredoxin:NAD+ oxidoreductase subunit B|nr:4Fe-4S binding protein [Bacteroidota bacterium]MBT3751087.1 4Fe-4S binding protein [Bacteroidota bacterium]MBT4411033.1 4Fe-4S binding protein [Bacteroidota bacterium]MBT5425823.1 4Fe-4S binding protein [Bacteroidota bacterium]MBT7094786.1 4Fe-4S binding protein [Bacteroidota bacterium]
MSCFITDLCTGCTACVKVCPVDAITGNRDELHVIDAELCIDCEACGRVCPALAIQTEDGMLIQRLKKSAWLRPTIVREKCVACESCVEVCPTPSLTMFSEDLPLTENYAVLSSAKDCISCNWCLDNCQYDAIRMEVQL